MVYEQGFKGKTMYLRPVEISDAEFLVKIRNDKEMTKYLHPVSLSVEREREWIARQRNRQGDYFFMICGLDGSALGAIRLSGIANGSGEVGSLVSYGNSVQNIEAELYITDFAFNIIGLSYLRGYTCIANRAVISYHKKLGYVYETEEKIVDGMRVYFARLEKDEWYKRRKKIIGLIEYVE